MSDANYLSPGVYIQELEGPAPIVGVSTSIAAFIGMAERGPVNVPILCTSPGDYTRWFGGLMVPDEFADPTDPQRFHCYLPYAVAGFFNNSGQVTYVIRVLPPEATAASEFLYDRTGASPIASALMRSAAIGDGAGTTPETGALIMLSPVPPTGTSIRIDDGSVSEYATIQAAAAVNEAVALDLPLALSHAKGTPVGPYARTTQGTPPYTLAADVGSGQTVITVVSSTDHLDQFNDLLIELVDGDTVAIVVPQVVVAVSANHYAVTLTQPLISGFGAATTKVTALVASPAAAYSAVGGPYTLNSDAALHATSLSVHSPTDDLSTIATPWPLELTDGPISAVVTVTHGAAAGGNDYTLTLSAPLSRLFPKATTTLTQLNSTPVSTLEVAASGGDTLIFVPGGGALTLGELVDIDPANPLAREIRMVGNAKSTAPPAALTQLSFTPPSSVNWPAKTAIIPVTLTAGGTTTLTADAPAGARTLSLASRTGINEGSVLLLGTSPKQEYASVIYVPGVRATAGPDPGPVTLGQGLVNGYTNGATVAASTVSAAPPAGRRTTQLVLDAPAGSTSALVSWGGGWAIGDIVEVELADGSVAYTTIDAAPTPQGLEQVQLATPVQRTHPAGSPVVSRNPLIQVQALDAGAWGQRIALAVQDEAPGLVSNVQVVTSIAATQLKLSALTGIQPGSYLELLYPDGTLVDAATPLKVAAVNRSTTTITLDPGTPISGAQAGAIGTSTPTTRIVVRSREFRLTIYLYRHPDPAVPSRNTQVIQTETFRNLSMDPRHSQYFQTVIGAINGPLRLSDRRPEGSSWLIRVQDIAPTQSPRLGPEPLIDVLPNGLIKPAQHKLDIGGDDSLATVDDTTTYIGADAVNPQDRTGIFALLNAPNVSIVAVPGQGTPAIQSALIDFCETSKYQFAVLDPRYPDSAIADIQAQRQGFDTKYAAIYYPWLTIPDPMPSNLALVPDFPLPPSGHVVGIYARTDDARGVFKAPANEVVRGITGLTQTLVEGDQDVLNPAPNNINVIRDFRPQGRGIRVWGARVITSDDNYKYVPVRRLLIFIEQSLNIGLQDVVFEPNTPQLWASVERVIGNFLYTVWTSGAFAGATPAQSFFVRCDQTTMTPDDIDAGRLIALVGVAPAMPAEFVIIQIALMTATTSQ